MLSIARLSCVLSLTCWLAASAAHAQSKHDQALELEVRSSAQTAQTCLSAEQLRARVVHYSPRSAAPRGLTLVLYVDGADAAELQIVRNDEVVSRRRFEQLPAACADRRDAVALSIALALERAVEAENAVANSTTAATAAQKQESAAASSGANEAAVQPQTAPLIAADAQPESQAAARAGSTPEPNAALTIAEPDAALRSKPPEPEPNAARPSAEPEPEPEPEPDSPTYNDSLPSSITHASPRDGRSPLQLHLGGRLTLEAVPMPVWVGSLGIELPLSRSITLDISALASSVGESALAGARARASFLGLEALGCAGTPLSIFMLQVCGGASVGLCTVNGAGYFRERPEATLLWAAGLARVILRWPQREMFALRLLVQPHLSISRPQLQVERSTSQLQTKVFGGSAGLELWLALP